MINRILWKNFFPQLKEISDKCVDKQIQHEVKGAKTKTCTTPELKITRQIRVGHKQRMVYVCVSGIAATIITCRRSLDKLNICQV